MIKLQLKGGLKKLKLYLRDPKKALDVAIGLFYLFFCIIWGIQAPTEQQGVARRRRL